MALKFNYATRLFWLLLAFCAVTMVCFVTFQYYREREFKAELLDSHLQSLNRMMIQHWLTDSTWNAMGQYRDDLRITVISPRGEVKYDNSLTKIPTENHLTRPEVAQARASGKGKSIDRRSHSNHVEYFYSATLAPDGSVVRTALPYSISLREVLKVDSTFLYFMFGVMIVVSLLGFVVTKRIGRTIARLNDFAQQAETGSLPATTAPFPPDELGSIASRIVRLYSKLQRASQQADREHAQALHQEQEKIRIKKQLTNNINHELKTPVASIQLCLETLQAHPDLPPEKRDEFISRCHTNAERLRRLLADVSTITRLDDGRDKVEMETVNVYQAADDAIKDEIMRPEAEGFTVDNRLPRQLEIVGNFSLITSVFRNLVSNALSYSHGSRITIELVAETPTQLTISVEDDGQGVPQEHLAHLFERFYRVDSGRDRQRGGTGLGLAIVKNAVLLHGGTISVTTAVPHGLRFLFTLAKNQ